MAIPRLLGRPLILWQVTQHQLAVLSWGRLQVILEPSLGLISSQGLRGIHAVEIRLSAISLSGTKFISFFYLIFNHYTNKHYFITWLLSNLVLSCQYLFIFTKHAAFR